MAGLATLKQQPLLGFDRCYVGEAHQSNEECISASHSVTDLGNWSNRWILTHCLLVIYLAVSISRMGTLFDGESVIHSRKMSIRKIYREDSWSPGVPSAWAWVEASGSRPDTSRLGHG